MKLVKAIIPVGITYLLYLFNLARRDKEFLLSTLENYEVTNKFEAIAIGILHICCFLHVAYYFGAKLEKENITGWNNKFFLWLLYHENHKAIQT